MNLTRLAYEFCRMKKCPRFIRLSFISKIDENWMKKPFTHIMEWKTGPASLRLTVDVATWTFETLPQGLPSLWHTCGQVDGKSAATHHY